MIWNSRWLLSILSSSTPHDAESGSHVFMLQYQTSGRSSAEMCGGSLRHFSHFSHCTHSTLSGSSSSFSPFRPFLPFLALAAFFLSFSGSLPPLGLERLRDELLDSAAPAASPPDFCFAFLAFSKIPDEVLLPASFSHEALATASASAGVGLFRLAFFWLGFGISSVGALLSDASGTGGLPVPLGGRGLTDDNFFCRLLSSLAFLFFSFATSCTVCSGASQLLRLGSKAFISQNQGSGSLSLSTEAGRRRHFWHFSHWAQ
mmetsp:Transcript_13591/g.38913  ORF Transcript_13591/g.38913 Transcript_13591/m.38913 type:complete len:260 (-) Transcript_13591:2498-3277(-)